MKKTRKTSSGDWEPSVWRSGADDDYLNRWKRIVRIDQRMRDGSFPNKRTLSAELGVDERTIQRDLRAMRLDIGAPIEYVAAERGFRYSADFAIPAATLGGDDLFALMVAEQAVAQYEGTPLADHLRDAFNRILGVLDPEVREAHAGAARSIRFTGLPPAAGEPEVWTRVEAAVRDHEILTVRYATPGKDERDLEVEPWVLTVRDREWFLAGRLQPQGWNTTLYLPRIRAAEGTGEHFAPPQVDDMAERVRDAFNAMTGGDEPRDVVLRFAPEHAHLARERKWSPDQSTTVCDDGSIEVRFRTSAVFEVERQVLRYGGAVELIEPAAGRAAVHDAARTLARAHE